MNNETLIMLIFSASLLLLGHVIRAVRWTLLFAPNSVGKRIDLLVALSIGYLINMFIPARLGEIFRTWYVSKKTSITWSYVLATIAAERFSDIIALLLMILVFYALTQHDVWIYSFISFFIVASIFLSTVYAIGIFNTKLQMSILNSAWVTSELTLNTGLLKTKYILASIIMWVCYLLAFYTFSKSIHLGFSQTFSGIMLDPFSANFALLNNDDNASSLLFFMISPLIAVLLYVLARRHQGFLALITQRKPSGWYQGGIINPIVKQKFAGDREYEFFLASLFSGNNYATTEFGLHAVSDSTIVRLFAGGSDAITALVSVDNKLMIRKFATNDASAKLLKQYEWINKHQNACFPLVRLVKRSQQSDPFYYDMPLVVPSSDYFDYIHTNPIDSSMLILNQVYETLSQHHQQYETLLPDDSMIDAYLQEKVISNTQIILSFAREFINGETFSINGKSFIFQEFAPLMDIRWLKEQIHYRKISEIHGDLTIENIIVAPNSLFGWYIIDPNSENRFNTPLIDWAKQFQSLHLGYESMNRNPVCHLENDKLSLPISKSEEYSILFKHLEQRILADHGQKYLNEVYFHELVNYLRLTPYKIRQDKQKGLCFFAATCLLWSHYQENLAS
jgi:hypothetical protein